jgi:hypothetical protein
MAGLMTPLVSSAKDQPDGIDAGLERIAPTAADRFAGKAALHGLARLPDRFDDWRQSV